MEATDHRLEMLVEGLYCFSEYKIYGNATARQSTGLAAIWHQLGRLQLFNFFNLRKRNPTLPSTNSRISTPPLRTSATATCISFDKAMPLPKSWCLAVNGGCAARVLECPYVTACVCLATWRFSYFYILPVTGRCIE